MRIGCNKSLSGTQNLNSTVEAPLTSPTSSTRSRCASGFAALILCLALLSSHINPIIGKSSRIHSKISQAYQYNHSCSTSSTPTPFSLLTIGQQSGTWQHMSSKQRNQFVKAINGNRDARGIKLAHWNPGSAHLHNKMTQLELAVADHKPHILGISEANFKRGHDLEDVQLGDYDLFLSKTFDNDDLGVSRVVCYKHTSLVGGLREDLMSDNFSSIWMEIGLPRKKKILVCQLYREWQHLGQTDRTSSSIPAQLDRWISFLDQWERAIDTGKEVIVMGDCNLDYLKFSDIGQLQSLVDLMYERIFPHGVQQCVKVPTRSWPGQKDSCLDHIYTNTPDKISQAEVRFMGSSDHKLVMATRFSKSFKQNIRYCKKRSYKNFNEEDFLREVENISWWEVYASEDVDVAVDIFTKKLTDILDRMAPVKKFQVRTKYATWLSEDTKEKIKDRDRAQEVAALSGSQEHWSVYKQLRNDLTTVLRKEKLSWEQGKLEQCEQDQDSGKLWKNVLGWLNWSSTSSPTKLLIDGDMLTSPQKMADAQNGYYINKVKEIRRNMPGQKKDPLATVRKIMNGKDVSFSLSAVSPDEVDKIIRDLKNSKSSGVDNLDTFILKLTRKHIVPSVCHIINLSIQSKKFPTKWKIAKVVPLYKGKGSKFDTKNYRPVAILPILSKVLERAMFKQVINFMDGNKLFNPSHHAYRSFHSTTTAMLQMYDTWLEAAEHGDIAGVCMVDMSAAFDVVDTDLLLEKMKLYGFDRNAVQWMWSYLTYRSQGVYIEGSMSKLLPLEAGVPQGSILGPVFYTIFTNELPQVIHEEDCPLRSTDDAPLFSIQCQACGGLCCYADDSTYTVTGKDPEQLTEKLTKKYSVMADFLTDNKLKVNDDKTHLLVMATMQKRRTVDTNATRIVTPSSTVEPSSTERLLGAEIHHDMRWREHILDSDNSLVKALNKRLGALRKIQKKASFRSRKMIANGIFMSKLIYLMPLWSGCEEYMVRALQVIQNKAARSVAKLNKPTPTKILLNTCGWLSVRQLMAYHSLILLHKTLAHQAPKYLYEKVTASGQFKYKTRQASECPPQFSFCVQHPTDNGTIRQDTSTKLGLVKKGWCWRSVEMFNTLPTNMRLEKKLPKFKTSLKNWVQRNINI